MERSITDIETSNTSSGKRAENGEEVISEWYLLWIFQNLTMGVLRL